MSDIMELWTRYNACSAVSALFDHVGRKPLVLYCNDKKLRFLLHVLASMLNKISFSCIDRSKPSELMYKCKGCRTAMTTVPHKVDRWCQQGCACPVGSYCNSKIDYYYCSGCDVPLGDTLYDEEELSVIERNNTIVIGLTKEDIIIAMNAMNTCDRGKFTSNAIRNKFKKNANIDGLDRLHAPVRARAARSS